MVMVWPEVEKVWRGLLEKTYAFEDEENIGTVQI